MNSTKAILCALALSAAISPARAFTSGSTGADGALDVPDGASTTLALPDSGIFNFTTVHIGKNAVLRFTPNAANTPVVMLASGDVTIDATGLLDISGKPGSDTGTAGDGRSGDDGTPGLGGPGGYAGGYGGRLFSGTLLRNGGNGLGPGGGVGNGANPAGGGGYGSSGSGGSYGGPVYGSAGLLPLLGGSGGAGGLSRVEFGVLGGGGGGGGGAILVASTGKITVNGEVRANGGAGARVGISSWDYWGSGGGGSGGGIHLMATEISGAGSLSAVGGAGGDCITYSSVNSYVSYRGGSGGVGRILLEADRFTSLPSVNPLAGAPVSVPANMAATVLPSVRIASVQNVSAPAVPNGVTDVRLPYTTASPVAVKIVTQGVPAGAKVAVYSVPRYGSTKTVTSDAIVPDATGRAEVQVNIGIEANQNTLFAITTN